MTLLQTFFWQTSYYCRTLKRKHFCWSLCLLKSESLDCSVVALEKKGQFRKKSPGPGVKMYRKNYRVKRGKELFLKTKKVLIKICNISHLLSCKLLRKFISWVSRNTKMPNCIVSFAIPIIVETAMEALPLLVASNISFQLRRTWSFCKYGLVLFLSLVYLVYCSVSVVIF